MPACDPGITCNGFYPSWYYCGTFDIPLCKTFTLKLNSVRARPIAQYHDLIYTVYGRITMNCTDYAVAPNCPNPNELNDVRDCCEVSCGEFCVSNGLLPDGN